MNLRQAELPVELQALDQILIALRNYNLGFQRGPACHNRLIGLNCQREQILDTRVGRDSVERNSSSFNSLVNIYHGPVSEQRGMKEFRDHAGENGIAVGSVNDRLEIGMKRHGMSRRAQGKIRSIRFPLDS